MNVDDDALRAILTAVLERPNDDAPRLAYAGRLEELGFRAEAAEIRRQIAEPDPGIPVRGAEVGVEIAEVATVRRGFVEEITLRRDRVAELGDAFDRHPITVVWVEGWSIAVEFGVPDSDECNSESRWHACLGSPMPPRGGIDQFMISASRAWDSRDDLARSIGAWADSVVPSPPAVTLG